MADDDTTRVFKRSNTSDSNDTKTTVPLFGREVKSQFESDPHTKIFRPNSASPNSVGGAESTGANFEVEPVVGWLVIIDGPGKGNHLKLGFGMNSIGRAEESRVVLDFGDNEISRLNHAMVTYDNKNRKFYIQHGGGANLTYLGDSPVLQPYELKGRERITIGNTKVCFIPFCGSDFNWD